ncbi:MAG: DegT/DnrJ/EryC1/StrS family aminotransferase [Rhodospirillaceae bacterium]
MSMTTSHSVPFFNFQMVFRRHQEEYTRSIINTVEGGGFILQDAVSEFESSLARFLGCRYAVGLADCTNAMVIGLRALGIGHGDEVIICSHTFLATAQSVYHTGAVPVPVEMRADRTIDPGAIGPAVTSRTKAILLTQLNGRCCNMDEVSAVASAYDLIIAEDSAQALGARFGGRHAGTFGRFGAFSFYPSKLLPCFGDGGALVTDDEGLAANVRSLRNHGANAHKVLDAGCDVWGTNCRLDNLQAAILNVGFPHLPAALARRRQIARTYHAAFGELNELCLPPGPDDSGRYFDVYQNYEIDLVERDALRDFLHANGVGTILQWAGVPVHQFRNLGFRQDLPVTDAFFSRCLLLPMNPYLTDEDVLYVCCMVRAYWGRPPWTTIVPTLAADFVALTP